MNRFEKKLVPAGIAMLASLCMMASAASVKKIPASEGIEEVSVQSDLFEDGLKASSITLSYVKKILPESVTADDYRIDEGRAIKDVMVKGKDVTLILDCSCLVAQTVAPCPWSRAALGASVLTCSSGIKTTRG